MNINDYIKEMKTIAEQSGISNPAEMNEVLTLALFKLLQSPALLSEFTKHKLEHHNDNNIMLGIMDDDLFSKHFIIDHDNTIKSSKKSFTVGDKDVQEVKKNVIKEAELDFLNIVKSSESFDDFCKNYSAFLTNTDKALLKTFLYRSKIEQTLVEAYTLLNTVKEGKTNRTHLIVEPFGEIQMNHVTPDFMEFVNKDINGKLDYLAEKDMLFRTFSSIDGVIYTSVQKFKEAYLNNELEEDSFLSKLLISDEPSVCIEAIFEGEWFDTYKETTLRSVKKALLAPSVNEMYERYPVVNVMVEAMYDKYPYFNIEQNDMIQIKTILETADTTHDEMEVNKKEFMEDVNQFCFKDKEYSEHLNKDTKHTRVYATSPFGVLMEVGGRHTFPPNQNLSVLYLDEIKMKTSLNDENEMICLNRFLKLCEEKNIVCAYDGENISERVKEIIKAHTGVASFDKSNNFDNLDHLLPYKVIIKDMNATYAEFLALKNVIPLLPENSNTDEMIKTFQAKLKQQNKLTL